jgi:DNA-binding MarR family transcriptional regulator
MQRRGPALVRDESASADGGLAEPPFTEKQGQYLAFIHYYTRVNGVAPAEADIARYFQVSPPAVHAMIVKLDTAGLIERAPGRARSIRLRVPRAQLPDLE